MKQTELKHPIHSVNFYVVIGPNAQINQDTAQWRDRERRHITYSRHFLNPVLARLSYRRYFICLCKHLSRLNSSAICMASCRLVQGRSARALHPWAESQAGERSWPQWKCRWARGWRQRKIKTFSPRRSVVRPERRFGVFIQIFSTRFLPLIILCQHIVSQRTDAAVQEPRWPWRRQRL